MRNNDVAPKENTDESKASSQTAFAMMMTRMREKLCCFSKLEGDDKPPKTWKERLTFVADNAKNDDKAPSYLFGHIRCYLVFDKDSDSFYRWLMVVNFAVLYNLIFVIGRSCFWEMENLMPTGWLVLDYCCDFLYVLDIFVRIHEGYLEQGLMVKDAKLLRKNYLKG